MRKGRVAAVLVVVVVGAGMVAHGVGTGWLSRFLPGMSADAEVRAAVARAIMDRRGRPIAILAESAAVDRTVAQALDAVPPGGAALIARDEAAIARAVQEGELLALSRGRTYLELTGFELEWLPQPPDAAAFPWSRVRGSLHCADIREDRWSPLPGLEYTGRLGVRLPPDLDGALVFIIGDAVPLDLEAQDLEALPVPMRIELLRPGPASTAPAEFWLGEGNPWSAPGSVVRVTFDAPPARPRLVDLRLGRRAPRVLARLKDYGDAARARVCAAPIAADPAFARARDLVVLPDTPEYFGTGWYGPELGAPGLGTIRWMKGQGAVLVNFARRGAVEVVVRGAPASGEPATLTLTVNDTHALPPAALAPGRAEYRWTVPAAAWLAGTNELLFAISRTARGSHDARDTRDLGFALQRLSLTLRE